MLHAPYYSFAWYKFTVIRIVHAEMLTIPEEETAQVSSSSPSFPRHKHAQRFGKKNLGYQDSEEGRFAAAQAFAYGLDLPDNINGTKEELLKKIT